MNKQQQVEKVKRAIRVILDEYDAARNIAALDDADDELAQAEEIVIERFLSILLIEDDDQGITKKELVALYKEAVAETSKKKAKKVLAKFDVEAVKELDEDEYGDVAKALNKLIG